MLAIGVRVVAGRLGVPTAGLLLVAAAAASDLVDRLATILTFDDVQKIATLALIVILFQGGSQIGMRRFRESAAPILVARGDRDVRDGRARRRGGALCPRLLLDRVRA